MLIVPSVVNLGGEIMSFNRKQVIEDTSKITVSSNDSGLIEAFGILVNQLPAAFWNDFADRIINSVPEELQEVAFYLLYNAANECGYHTGYGIITSDEWEAVVKPHVKREPEDILHGAFAVFTAWGWGKAEIVELIPNDKMVLRAYDYYEADIVQYGKSHIPMAAMIAGVSAAFMDLAYGAPYPNGLGTFKCEQVKGIECGDDYGEFVITRNN
jgi:hypothetical protein